MTNGIGENVNTQPRGMAVWTMGWLALTLVSFAYFARPNSTAMDEDEIYWIGSTYYFQLAAHPTQWRHPDWMLLPARENPPVAKYVLGLGLAAAGHSVTSIDLLSTFYLMFERVPHAWGTGSDHAKRSDVVSRMNPAVRENIQAGGQVRFDRGLLVSSRWTMIACAAITSFLMFLLGAKLSGPLAGLIGSQLLALHPTFVHAYNHAHADIVAMLFSAASALALFGWIAVFRSSRSTSLGSDLLRSLTVGMLLALACGAKMNSLVLVAMAGISFLFIMVPAWKQDAAHGRRILFSGTILFGSALVFFILLNPAIAADIPGGLIAAVREHQLTEVIQSRFLPDHLPALPAKLGAVARLTCFSVAGLVALALIIVATLASKQIGLRFASAWSMIGLLFVTLWIPFPRGRYVLPVVLPTTLLIGCAISWLAALVVRRRALASAA
jgi:hypothetical protein